MSQRLKSLFLIIFDSFILLGALVLTLLVFRKGIFDQELWHYHLQAFQFLFPVWLMVFYIEGLYSLKFFKNSSLVISLVRTHFLNTIISLIYFYLFMDEIAPKKNLLILSAISFLGMFLIRKLFLTILSTENLLTRVLLIGNEADYKEINLELNERKHLGYKIVKFQEHTLDFTLENIDLVVIDRNFLKKESELKKVFSLLDQGVNILDFANFSEMTSGKVPISAIEESWFIQYCGIQKNRTYEFLKNLIDRLVALVLMLLILPVYIPLLFILLIVHGRPIFFIQQRTGHFNKPFYLYKLRSMIVNAESSGAQWSKPGDSRITPIGKFLRKTRLDEIPQLWNIFKGDMSLVGPRPERPEMINSTLAVNIPFYNQRHLVKPGVTGWAQVNFRYGYSENDSLQKLQYDLYYIKNKSIWLDLSIILKTVKTVLTGAGQ